jgi:adenine-specific DNA-methyltransferase
MNFHSKLVNLLKTDKRFVDDQGELLLAAVQDQAWKVDRDLIKLLLSDKEVKGRFFEEIDAHWVFNFNTFIDFISQKNFLENSYTRFRNTIGLTIDGKYLNERGEVALTWPYKDTVLEGGQTKEEEKRREIFFNEVLAQDEITRLLDPKVLTNFVRYTAKGKQPVEEFKRDENGIIRENLIIKGNNLLTLHVLKTQYRHRVNVIYIDPPYNPDSNANTFIYNNNFNHSAWLTFMKNRLEVAKELLTEDGILIVAIDENEQVYLGVLLKELFKDRETHCITIVHNPRGVQGTNFSYTHEYAFFVIPAGKKSIGDRKIKDEAIDWSPLRNWGGESRREDARNCFYPVIVEDGEIVGFGNVFDEAKHPASQTVNSGKKSLVYPIDRNGVERKWRYARQSVEEIKHLLRAKEIDGGYEIEIGKDFGTYKTVWEDSRYDANAYGTQLVNSLVPNCPFDFPKSLWNVYDCLHAAAADNKQAIILDFFGGSGTTAHAVIELNKDGGDRKFIICEQMDYAETVTVARVKAVLKAERQGEFVFYELLKYNEAFIESIQAAESPGELVKIWKKMAEGSFLNWYVNPRVPEDAIREFEASGKEENGLEKQKRLLVELLDKNQLYVNLSEIDDAQFKVSKEDKELNKAFYGESYSA